MKINSMGQDLTISPFISPLSHLRALRKGLAISFSQLWPMPRVVGPTLLDLSFYSFNFVGNFLKDFDGLAPKCIRLQQPNIRVNRPEVASFLSSLHALTHVHTRRDGMHGGYVGELYEAISEERCEDLQPCRQMKRKRLCLMCVRVFCELSASIDRSGAWLVQTPEAPIHVRDPYAETDVEWAARRRECAALRSTERVPRRSSRPVPLLTGSHQGFDDWAGH